MFELGYKKNEIVLHDELCKKVGCGCMGGIRYSKKNNALLLFMKKNSQYENKWNGDVLQYMGCGKGNQSADAMANARLTKANENNTAIFLIEWVDDMRCKYLGKMHLIDEPEYKTRINSVGEKERKVFFYLKEAE